MASLIDSKAHFAARAAEYNVPADAITNLTAAGIETLGQLAFSFSRPGQEYSDADFTTWLTTVMGGVAPTMGASAAIRRLHFESEVIVTASLKSMVENPASDSAQPKPIPQAEKLVRMDRVKAQLTGINIEGPNEPSQALLEEAVQQYDNKVLKYIEPARCTSREAELLVTKVDKRLHLDSNASLSVKETKQVPDADTHSAFNLMQCFRRRAVAYEFAQLISFTAHEKYVDKLFRHLSLEAPPNFQQTSLQQILRADRQVFVYLCREVASIRPTLTGDRPLDNKLLEALQDYNTAFHLMPLPSHATYAPLRNEQDAPTTSPKGDFKGGKGKGKKGKGSSMAPRGMLGCVGRDPKGRPICFDFNLSKCDRGGKDGGQCNKGRHICFKAGCFKNHPFCKGHPNEMPAKE